MAAVSRSRRRIADIYVIEADGTRERLVAHAGGDDPSSDLRSSFSPDGSALVFAGRVGGSGAKDLYTVRDDGSVLTRLTGGDGARSDYWSPLWSPDGRRILSARSGVHGLAVMNADGSGVRTVADDGPATWLSGGTVLAWQGTESR